MYDQLTLIGNMLKDFLEKHDLYSPIEKIISDDAILGRLHFTYVLLKSRRTSKSENYETT